MSKKCTPLWREAHFEVKMYKALQLRSTFNSCDVEKVHAIVARSTCRSQNVKSTRGSDHFWKLRCRKSARRCGAKHISKSKCEKKGFGPLLEVQMSFGWQAQGIVHLVKSEQKGEGFVAFSITPTTTPHYIPIRYTTTTTTPSLHSTTLHYTPPRSTTLHYTQLRSVTLHYTTNHYTTLHYTNYIAPLHSTPRHATPRHATPLHSTPHHTTVHYTA